MAMDAVVSAGLMLIGCGGATAFFALLFHAPKRCILAAALASMAGYGVYMAVYAYFASDVAGVFFAALLIALLGEALARRLRAPSTVFTSSAVIPLVPGAGLYNTMLSLVQDRYADAAVTGVDTLLMAGAIALAIALVTSLVYAGTRAKRKKP